RNFRDDDLLHAALDFLGVGLAADADDALAGAQVAVDAFAAGDDAAGGKIGALHDLHDFIDGDGGFVDDGAGRGDEFVEIVRRDVGRHADGDAGRAVHQQIRQGGGQNSRLGGGLLVIGGEIDGVFLDVAQQFLGDFG